MKSDLKMPALAGVDRKATIASSSSHLPHALTHRGGDVTAAAEAEGMAQVARSATVVPELAPIATMATATYIDHLLQWHSLDVGVRAGCLFGRHGWQL